MFTKCIKCDREIGTCILKLIILPFNELIGWANQTKKKLFWTNQILADKSGVPVGTVGRVLSGDTDCKYSTMRCILLALLEGVSAEFPCPELVPTVQHLELLAQQAEKLVLIEKENVELRAQIEAKDEQHRSDIRIIRSEYQEQIKNLREDHEFFKDQLRAWQSR